MDGVIQRFIRRDALQTQVLAEGDKQSIVDGDTPRPPPLGSADVSPKRKRGKELRKTPKPSETEERQASGRCPIG